MLSARATIPKLLPLASLLYGDVAARQNLLIIVSPLCLPGKPTVKINPHSAQYPPPRPAPWAVQCTEGWGPPHHGPGTELPQPAAGGSVPTLSSSTALGGRPACHSPQQQPRSLCSGHQKGSFIAHSCLFPQLHKSNWRCRFRF